jgi:putative Mn2+ efflux pump MntP
LTAEYLLDEDTQATRRNLDPVRDRRDPKQVHAETAGSLAWVLVASFAVLLAAVVGCGTAIAYHAPGEAGSVIGLFAAVLTTLGTALGGVVGFYFRQRDDDTGPKHTNPPSGESPPPGAA